MATEAFHPGYFKGGMVTQKSKHIMFLYDKITVYLCICMSVYWYFVNLSQIFVTRFSLKYEIESWNGERNLFIPSLIP